MPPIPLSCHCNNVATFEKFCCPTESHCLFEATPYASQWTSGCCCKLILGLSVYRLLSKRDKAWDLVRNSKGKTRLAWVCERQKDKEEKQRNLCVCLCRQHYCCLQWMCMCVSFCVCACAWWPWCCWHWECSAANPRGEQSTAEEMLGRSPLIRVTAVGGWCGEEIRNWIRKWVSRV